MKHKGSVIEHSEEMAAEMVGIYEDYIRSHPFVKISDFYETLVEMPASRFYVSEERAIKVIYLMIQGKADIKKMYPMKRDMYREILRRVLDLKRAYPERNTRDLCIEVVNQPAPKFYITAASARQIISRYRKKWQREKQRLLQKPHRL